MSIPPPREPRNYIVHRSDKLTGDVKDFFKEHEETIKKYNEKPKAGQDLTILEIKDSREIVEVEQKEVIKKEKEITDTADLPDDLVEQVLMKMEEEEKEETVQGEVVESQPMQIEGEEEVAEEDEAVRNARELEEGFTVEYLVKNFITTSSEDPKDTIDLKYMNIRLVFDPNYSLYISSDTRLSGKTVTVQEEKDGILVNRDKLRVFANSDYKITEFEGETRHRTEIQEDFEFTRRTRPNEERYIPTGMSPKVSSFKHVIFGNAKFSLGVTNTILGKSITEPDEGDDPMDKYNMSRYYFYRYKDVVDRRNELSDWFHTHGTFRGFNQQLISFETQLDINGRALAEANQRLIKDIQVISKESAIRKDGTPYTSVEQYFEDFNGIDIDQFRDMCINSYKQGRLSEEDYQEFLQAIDNYVNAKNAYAVTFDNYTCEKNVEDNLIKCYIDVVDNNSDQYDIFNEAKKQIGSFERAIKGEKMKITKPKFSIQIEVTHGGNIRSDPYKYMPVRITIHGESVEQQRRLQEIFNKKIVAIIVRTSEYAPSPLVDQRRRDFADWKKAKEAAKTMIQEE